MRRASWLALLILAPFAVQGCGGASSVLPAAAIAVKGASKASEASRPINDSEEYYVGRAVAARILSKYKLDQNPKLTQYVNEVGQTVARKSTRPTPSRATTLRSWTPRKSTPLPVPGALSSLPGG